MSSTIGIYLRLSDEDDMLGESNSISSQRAIIQRFITSHTEFSAWNQQEFADDGFSGTSFQRPAMQELMCQVKTGKIQCIIVKDLSRFGRNYIEVGTYLEQVFPFLGVRFIAINDQYDSASPHTEFMGVAFKNLMSDLYSKDLSQKIVTARRTRASTGKFVTAFAPYGYLKSKEKMLVPDPEAAPIVKRIFANRDCGASMAQIARDLNRDSVPSPMMLRKSRGDSFSLNGGGTGDYVWKTSVISSILADQRYVGDSVYGKVKPSQIGGRKDIPVPKDEWIIVPDTHQGLIPREVFERIKSQRKQYNKKPKEPKAPLSGKVKCGSCGHIISRRPIAWKNNKIVEYGYRCSYPCITPRYHCYEDVISETTILEVLNILLTQYVQLSDMSTAVLQERMEIENFTKKLDAECIQITSQRKALKTKKRLLYESFRCEKPLPLSNMGQTRGRRSKVAEKVQKVAENEANYSKNQTLFQKGQIAQIEQELSALSQKEAVLLSEIKMNAARLE
ncbi:MAG: recombinase family protein, partial [Rikenellaceae bacterium]